MTIKQRTNFHDWAMLNMGGDEVLVCLECGLTHAETLEQDEPGTCWGADIA